MTMRILTRMACAAIVLFALTTYGVVSPLLATPSSQGSTWVPVTIALVDRLEDPSAGAMILRRRHEAPRDVILLARSSANAERLSAAVASLLIARQQHGDIPRQDAKVAVLADRGPQRWATTEVPRAQRVLARLRRVQSGREIAGVGRLPAVDIYLRSVRVTPR